MNKPIRVGAVGCGLIAQVMHLPYLKELPEQFELTAVCDLSQSLAEQCAQRYGARRSFTRWDDLVNCGEVDAIMVLTSGNHAPPAVAAAQAGLHVFTEKPMALSSWDCAQMIDAAETPGVTLMVGTMKRYDPAYERLGELLTSVRPELRLVRVTTLESPFEPYVAHYPLLSGDEPSADILEALGQADEQAVDRAMGEADELTRRCYRWILLDNLVHELNALRGVLGEPTEIVSAILDEPCVSVNLRFGRGRLPSLMGGPAGDRPLQTGVRFLRAGRAADAGTALAVPAQRPQPAHLRRAATPGPRTAGSARRSSPTTRRSSASWWSSPNPSSRPHAAHVGSRRPRRPAAVRVHRPRTPGLDADTVGGVGESQ